MEECCEICGLLVFTLEKQNEHLDLRSGISNTGGTKGSKPATEDEGEIDGLIRVPEDNGTLAIIDLPWLEMLSHRY